MKLFAIVLSTMISTQVSAIEIKHELGFLSFPEAPQRIVTLNWAVTETVLALGVTPVGMSDIDGYRKWVGSPLIPEGVTDLGLRREPNMELLRDLKPDLIVTTKEMQAASKSLEAIAPVVVLSIFDDRKTPLVLAKTLTMTLGKILDRQQQAEELISETDQILEKNAQRLLDVDEPILLIRLLSKRSVRVHGVGSLIHDTITGMGLSNAWQADTNNWGFSKAGIDKLAQHQNAHVMLIGPVSEKEQAKLNKSALWNAMQFSKENKVDILPAVWTFGSLVAVQRFSEQIANTLSN